MDLKEPAYGKSTKRATEGQREERKSERRVLAAAREENVLLPPIDHRYNVQTEPNVRAT